MQSSSQGTVSEIHTLQTQLLVLLGAALPLPLRLSWPADTHLEGLPSRHEPRVSLSLSPPRGAQETLALCPSPRQAGACRMRACPPSISSTGWLSGARRPTCKNGHHLKSAVTETLSNAGAFRSGLSGQFLSHDLPFLTYFTVTSPCPGVIRWGQAYGGPSLKAKNRTHEWVEPGGVTAGPCRGCEQRTWLLPSAHAHSQVWGGHAAQHRAHARAPASAG